MEEKRICSDCGARLRPGAKFCSACGAIIRNNPPAVQNEQPVETQTKPVEKTPVKEPRRPEPNARRSEYYFYEKPSTKAKPAKKANDVKYKKQVKETNSIELASGNRVLWNALTGATSLVSLILGIILLCVTFMSYKFEGFSIGLKMSECLDVLFNKDIPIFFESADFNTTSGLVSGVGLCGLLYLVVAIGYVCYNLVIYGKYSKMVLIINTACSAALTIFSVMLLVFYLMIQGACIGGTNFSSSSIFVLILTVIVLLADIAKMTILYQYKLDSENHPSYLIDFVTNIKQNIWKFVGIVGGSLGFVALIIVVLFATAKSPAIKVWDRYVDAFNAENSTLVTECYFPNTATEEFEEMQTKYKEIFNPDGANTLTSGKATLVLRTEKYVKVNVDDVSYNGGAAKSLTLHFGKVNDEWYLMSYVDVEAGGNTVEVNEFNQEAGRTILKINDNILRGFSVKLSKSDISKITELVIPNGVEKIESKAFAGLESLEKLVIPSSVKVIESGAFTNCVSLQELTLGAELNTIEANAFEGCATLEKVILPESLTTVGRDAFKDCSTLTIYANYKTTPSGFDANWNPNNCTVYLDTQWDKNDPEQPNRYHMLTINANGGTYENLDEDEYYPTGDWAKLPVPTKLGCEFLGWYTTPDFQESSKITVNPKVVETIKMENDVTLYAKWNENMYTIKYNLDGGTLANMVTSYTVGDVIVLGSPVKKGYTFVGWTGTGLTGETEVVKIEGQTGDREYTAVFKANIYTITLNANGGTGTGTIQATFDQSVVISGKNFNNSGMKLIGWNTEKDGSGTNYKNNQTIDYVFDSNMTLYAIWASLITLDPNGGTLTGSVPSIKLNATKYVIPVPTTKEYKFFDGWYLGEQRITDASGNGIIVWLYENEVTLTARWVDKYTENGITYMYRGDYPQTRVTDAELISVLSRLTPSGSTGYIEYNGERYAKVEYRNAATTAKFNDGTKLKNGSTYYFLVEKVKWRVLDDGKLLISDLIIDAIAYYDDNETRIFHDPDQGDRNVYPNNYVYSTLNAWLNNGVVDRLDSELPDSNYENNGLAVALFGSADDLVSRVQYTLNLDNSGESTKAPGNPFVWGNSEAFLFALSHKEVADDYSAKLGGKATAYVTDYAISQDLEVDDTKNTGAWWLRSPYHENKKYALYVTPLGNVTWRVVTDEKVGVRPAMYIK